MNLVAISCLNGVPFFSNAGISNPELEHRAQRSGDKFSENVHIIANEPSLAFYRIQEHVRKSLPHLVENKREVEVLQQEIKGATFDTEYCINTVRSMEASSGHFQKIQELLKNTMFMKQQLHYEESRRSHHNKKKSMYRPLSMMSRTQTLDLPLTGGASSSAGSDFTHSLQINRPGSAGSSPQIGRVRSSSLSEKR